MSCHTSIQLHYKDENNRKFKWHIFIIKYKYLLLPSPFPDTHWCNTRTVSYNMYLFIEKRFYVVKSKMVCRWCHINEFIVDFHSWISNVRNRITYFSITMKIFRAHPISFIALCVARVFFFFFIFIFLYFSFYHCVLHIFALQLNVAVYIWWWMSFV